MINITFSKKTEAWVAAIAFLLTIFISQMLYPGYRLYLSSREVVDGIGDLKSSFEVKDINAVKKDLESMGIAVARISDNFEEFAFLGRVPVVGLYYRDGERVLKSAILSLGAAEMLADSVYPFADVLGFKTEDLAVKELTTREKISALATVAPQVATVVDDISSRLDIVSYEISQIDPNRYPQKIRGVEVREKINEVQTLLSDINTILPEAKIILELSSRLLGGEGKRTYLILLQNDKELRATGGFITAYALLEVESGEIASTYSDDIYNLDITIPNKDPAPESLKKYLGVSQFHLRDANLSPDFKLSAQKVLEFWGKAPGATKVDSVVAINTEVVRRLISITGPISLSEYSVDPKYLKGVPAECLLGGRSFTAQNVVCRLELFAEVINKSEPDRKGVVGDLMRELIDKISLQHGGFIDLFDTSLDLLVKKDILLYSPYFREQELFERLDFAGRIKDYPYDFLHINDSNLGGLKANFYIKERVEKEVRVEDGKVVSKVSIFYENPEPADGWLNGPYRDWVRVYVPKDSKLISAQGAGYKIEEFEDLGKTVFATFLIVYPEKKASVSFEYELPPSVLDDGYYKLFIQKQPANNIQEVAVKFNGVEKKVGLEKDVELVL